MLDLPLSLVQTLNLEGLEDLVVFLEVVGTDGTTFRYIKGDDDTTWSPDSSQSAVLWQANAFEFSSDRTELLQKPVQFEVSIQNADLAWTTYLEGLRAKDPPVEFNGSVLSIYLASKALLGTSGARIAKASWYISGSALDGEMFRVHVGAPFDALIFQVPGPDLGATMCVHVYKGPRCLSASSLPDCDHSVCACRARFIVNGVQHPIRFSSWPAFERET